MKKIISCILIFNFLVLNCKSAFAQAIKPDVKYPCYCEFFLENDKYENLNRKVFNFNLKMNKIFLKTIHFVWASILPEFAINSLNRIYSNLEYPKRAVSSILQHDFDALKHETKRFIINTTIGAGGIIDAADKLFNLELYNEDMEQALAKCKMKCGKYLVLPFISSTTTRDIFGRILDFALNPTTYIATPITAAIKMGLLINRTAYIQPMIKMVESNFADPYDIARKFFGVEKYIKLSNYDRTSVITNLTDDYDETDLVDSKPQEKLQVKGTLKNENLIVNEKAENDLSADIFLSDYNPQNPVLDSMRTVLFDTKEAHKSIWAENSLWNRNFNKKIRTANVNIIPNGAEYTFRYVLQKDKKSPLVIIFPSVGEGVNNAHSSILAKIFYDKGYSVLITGSHFQWEFLKSLEKGYKLGYIKDDVKYVNLLVNNAINYLSKKYDRVFLKRTAIGTSLGAYTVLFLANEQFEQGANNIDKFIAICPPCELTYAISKIDGIIEAWKNYPGDYREKTTITVAKVLNAYKNKEKITNNFSTLPFSNYEAKLISAFIFHQKLSDLIYVTELQSNPDLNKKELYDLIYRMNFEDYMKKYVLKGESYDELSASTSLKSISDYLISKDNYKIYHSLDDYLTNKEQLSELKKYCENKLVLFNNGAHLGFLYRDEFINELKKEIEQKN